MAQRSPAQAIEEARARFDVGNHRGALDSLTLLARRDPEVVAYREALVDFYRRLGSPDQAGRWGAHDPSAMTERETRALRGSVRNLGGGERRIADYLGLPDGAPPGLLDLSEPTSSRTTYDHEDVVETLEAAAVGAVGIGGAAFVLGALTVFVIALSGGEHAQLAAKVTLLLLNFTVAFAGGCVGLARLIARRWIWAGVFLAWTMGLIVLFIRLDPTTPEPFG